MKPDLAERPPVRLTALSLTAGTGLSAALLAIGFLLTVAALHQAAGWVSTAGVVILLATPALGLLATFVELRPVQRRAAALALVVLAILGMATLLALIK